MTRPPVTAADLLAEDEAPVLADLAAVGVDVDSVWDLWKVPDSLPAAVPVLLDHLAQDHADLVHRGMGNVLGKPSVRPWWDQIKALYLSTPHDVVRDRLASALAQLAVRAQYDDLLAFLRDESLGPTRIYFMRPVNRIGNRISAGAGRAVIEPLADDPVLGPEARQVLAGRSRSA